jgi:riboflavin synthase
VYGHVDATARVASKSAEGQGHRLRIELPGTLAPYIVEKGYVAIDGVSLTVAAVRDGCFEIALIPETSQRTTLGVRDGGSRVNVEIDPVARYAVAAILYRENSGSPTDDEIDWAYEI